MKLNVDYIGHYGNDLLVVNCARVSFNKWKEDFSFGEGTGSDERLLKYLAKENHFMPFCHPHITMRITAPIFIARQAAKHQIGFAWSEESRRYVDNKPEYFWIEPFRLRPDGNIKQGSGDAHPKDYEWRERTIALAELTRRCYNEMIDDGIAPEIARSILPQNTMTTWIWTGSLAAWARAYKLRSSKDSQLEIQNLSSMWNEIIEPLFPVSWSALVDGVKNES